MLKASIAVVRLLQQRHALVFMSFNTSKSSTFFFRYLDFVPWICSRRIKINFGCLSQLRNYGIWKKAQKKTNN